MADSLSSFAARGKMSWNWEEFTHKSDYRAEMVRVSLNGRGHFHFNQKAVDEMGDCEAVVLLFERSERLIAIKPSSPDVEHSYRLIRQGASTNYYVRAKSFCTFYGIHIPDALLFHDVVIDHGMLVLSLENVSEIIRRARLPELPIRFPEPPRSAPRPKFTTMLRMRSQNED